MKNLRAISLSIVMAVAAATAFATPSMADDGITNGGGTGSIEGGSPFTCYICYVLGD
ncbi:MAG: hypothetical protein ACR2O8_12090 [Rhizobiaceae bacterium]